jgi:hypothetical protein
MPERLFQTGFGQEFEPTSAKDMTPKGFAGLGAVTRQEAYDRLTSEPTPELGRFVREVQDEVRVSSPQDAAAYLQENVYSPFDQFDQEELWALLLDTKNRITHEAMIYRGTVNTVTIRPAELFKEAVRVNATAIILSHCHPSGASDVSPVIWRKMSNLLDRLKEGFQLSDWLKPGIAQVVN